MTEQRYLDYEIHGVYSRKGKGLDLILRENRPGDTG